MWVIIDGFNGLARFFCILFRDDGCIFQKNTHFLLIFLKAIMETQESTPLSSLLDNNISDYELERGKPMPSKNHAHLQTTLSFELYGRYRHSYSILSEISIRLLNDKATPDIAIFPKMEIDWNADEITLSEPPLTTIEILSPTQALDTLLEKSEDYFSIGVCSCWIVLPKLETILLMQANRQRTYFQRGDTLTDPTNGITLEVEEVFGN
jgi:Uma2 family endonuclease